MNNEVRNELLMILQIIKEENKDDKELRIDWLLERFECDLHGQLKEVEYKKQELENNLKTLEYVRKEIAIRRDLHDNK